MRAENQPKKKKSVGKEKKREEKRQRGAGKAES